jgi:hypothetical protein
MMNIDDDLAAWAAATRLSDAAAEAIFQQARTPEPGLDARWWRDLSAGLATTIVAATRPRRRAA